MTNNKSAASNINDTTENKLTSYRMSYIDAAEQLRQLAQVARTRNGRLNIDWISRSQKPKWKMLRFDGAWYDRNALRRLLARRPQPPRVPSTARALLSPELGRVTNTNPWRLGPEHAYANVKS